jgi:beta-lactam-binding protein with PASTA domain
VFKFITNKPFWVNLLIVFAITLLVLFSILQLLGVITNHGKYLNVPSVIGKNTNEAIKMLEQQGFDVIIKDSVYTDTAKMGTVLKQIPDPNSTVKINRTVMITVNRLSLPMIDMPALEGKSLNFALDILRRSHLVLGDTIFRPDFMRGSVLEQMYLNKKIKSGTKLPWGSAVDLVIGSGLNQEPVVVPDLLGMTYEEAKIILEGNGILIGALLPDSDVTDTAAAFIWKQSPPRYNDQHEPVFIQSGQLMDLWLSVDKKIIEDSTAIQ